MSDKWPHVAAVLAGGASSRMGRPKETLPLADGSSMIGQVAAVLAEVARCVVVLGSTDALPDLPRIADCRPGRGPLGGIEALLASGLDTQYLVCPCDVPRISAELLRKLLATTGAAVTVLRVEGETRFRPLPARFSAAALPAVRAALDADRLAVHAVIETLRPAVVEVDPAAHGLLANINTPADYDAL